MKILRIIYDWPPPWDGLAAAPYEMTAAQVKLGHNIEVFCGRWPFSGPIEKPTGVKTHSFIREPLAGLLNLTISPIMFVYYLFWKLKNDIDVIHSHGHFAIWIYWYRSFLKKRFPKAKELKTPLVVHFHNTVQGRWEKMKEQGKRIKPLSKHVSWPLGVLSDKWAVEVADACIFVSKDLRLEAIKYYDADSSKCFVVETGVNPELFTPIGSEELIKTRAELGLTISDKVLFYNGHMVERKNVHLIIESLRFLPANYKLLLVGPESDKDYEDKMTDITIKYDLGHRIVRVGYTPYPQIPIAFQAADLFVLPGVFEGLPKVVMQSLACGIPALASGFEVERPIKGLEYLKELTPEAIAKKVLDMISRQITVDLGTVRGNHSWNLMAKKVDAVYAKVVSPKT